MNDIYFVHGVSAVTCLIAVAARYRGREIHLVPGDLVLAAFLAFYVVPTFLDAVGYVKEFYAYPVLGYVGTDLGVVIIADLSIIFYAVFFSWLVRRQSERPRAAPFHDVKRPFWLALAFLPVLVALFAPDPGVYKTFAAVIEFRKPGEAFYVDGSTVSPAAQYHVYINWSAYVSALATAVYLSARRSNWAFLMLLPVGFVDLWLGGKRYIIAVLVIMALYSLLVNRTLSAAKLRRTAVMIGAGFAVLLSLSAMYQQEFRPHLQERNPTETFKVDFGRTDIQRLAIAGERGIAPRAFETRGESVEVYTGLVEGYLGDARTTISYQDRMTSIAHGRYISDQTGSITTSLFTEMIADAGYFGILLGPLIIGALLVASQRVPDLPLSLALALAAVMLLVLDGLVIAPVMMLAISRLPFILAVRRRRNAQHDGSATVVEAAAPVEAFREVQSAELRRPRGRS